MFNPFIPVIIKELSEFKMTKLFSLMKNCKVTARVLLCLGKS